MILDALSFSLITLRFRGKDTFCNLYIFFLHACEVEQKMAECLKRAPE